MVSKIQSMLVKLANEALLRSSPNVHPDPEGYGKSLSIIVDNFLGWPLLPFSF